MESLLKCCLEELEDYVNIDARIKIQSYARGVLCRLKYRNLIKEYTLKRLTTVYASCNQNPSTFFYGEFKKLFKTYHIPGSDRIKTLVFMKAMEITNTNNETGLSSKGFSEAFWYNNFRITPTNEWIITKHYSYFKSCIELKNRGHNIDI